MQQFATRKEIENQQVSANVAFVAFVALLQMVYV